MAAFLIDNMAPLMFAALVVFLLLGYPVAFALGAIGLSFGFLGIQLGLLTPQLFQALPERIFGIMAQRHAAGDAVLHLHGADPRAQRHGRGPARHGRASCSARCAAGSPTR